MAISHISDKDMLISDFLTQILAQANKHRQDHASVLSLSGEDSEN